MKTFIVFEKPKPQFQPMRQYKGNAAGLVITLHAIKRFNEKSKSQKTNEQVTHQLLTWMETAQEVVPKKHYGVVALLNHGFQEAKYYRRGEWVMVVSGGKMVTIHNGEAKRWRQA